MRLASKERYLIFVRPPGSRMWTQHMKENGNPYLSFSEEQALDDACKIVEEGKYCAHVAKVELKREIDTILKATTSGLDVTYFSLGGGSNQDEEP